MDGWDWISEVTYTKSTYGAINGIRVACSTTDIIDCLLVYYSTNLLVFYFWSTSGLVVPQLLFNCNLKSLSL